MVRNRKNLKADNGRMMSSFVKIWLIGLLPVIGMLFVFERAYHQFHWMSFETFHSLEPGILWFSILWILAPFLLMLLRLCQGISASNRSISRRIDDDVDEIMRNNYREQHHYNNQSY
jgi:hypothetical protein